MSTPLLETLVAPFDVGRSALLRAVGRSGARWSSDRDARIALIGFAAIFTAFSLTVVAPTALLALGPILFGVPHLVADVRHLVARPALHRVRWLWLAALPLIVVGFGGGVRVGLLAVPIAIFAARADARRSIAALVAWSIVYAAAWCAPWMVDLVFVHAHNFIAVIVWWMWRPSRGRAQRWMVVAFVFASLALLAGAAEPILAHTGGFRSSLPVDLGDLAFAVAPNASPRLALRLLLLYAFAQSVHYAVWLRLVPEDDRSRRAPRSFASSVRALRDDLGGPLLVGCTLAAAVVALVALFDLVAARDGYLRAAQFHGHLELAAVAFLVLRPRAR